MNSCFSRITVTTIVSLLAGVGLSSLNVHPDALALAREPQLPNVTREAKKRVKEEEKRLKEEEEKRLKEAENKLREEEKRLKDAEDKLREEEKRLKEEEEKRLKDAENKLREEERRLKEEEENRLKEEARKLREEERRLKEEEENRLKDERNRLKEEENRLKEEGYKLREEERRLKEEKESRPKVEEGRRNEEPRIGAAATAAAPVRADGLDIAILMKNSRGMFAPVDPSREFVNGDQFRVEYNSRLDGIVYFVNVDPKGVATVIYRDEVRYGEKYVHPSPEENKVIQFRGSAGVEVLKIIISPKEIPDLENALLETGGRMGTNTRQARDELLGYVAPKQEPGNHCGGLEFSAGGAKAGCRELQVVSMKQDQGKISVAVTSKGGGAGPDSTGSAKLSKGEMAVLEIRLKHVQR